MRHLIRHRNDAPAPPPLRFEHAGQPAFLRIENASEESYEAEEYLRLRRYRAGHLHDVYHILLYTSGRNRMLYGDALHPARRGLLACTEPGQRHEFRPRDPGKVAYRQVTFTAWSGDEPLRLSFPDLLHNVGGTRPPALHQPIRVDRSDASRIAAALSRLLDCGQRDDALRSIGLAVALLDVFVAVAEAAMTATTPETSDPLEAVRKRIESRLTQPVSVSELARLAECSQGHLHRRFKSRFGESPVAYHLRLRCEAAKNLLRTTDDSLAEIGERLGFGDPYHFSRAFTRHAGIPPGRFRREGG
mgnify:CR=1 FL=1